MKFYYWCTSVFQQVLQVHSKVAFKFAHKQKYLTKINGSSNLIHRMSSDIE